MTLYPYKFVPIYKERIWGGRNLERLFGRQLPPDVKIGESWELADLNEGVSVVANGPDAGRNLTDLTRTLGASLLGTAAATADGRFPLLLKLLDANDILSLQVHPDERAVAEIPGAALKTECWYVMESRDGYIYKGVRPGVTSDQFRQAVTSDTVEQLVQRYNVQAGDFHYLPAGAVHALGRGVVVAEVQTPSDTTYRVTDWGRGREIHVERSMQCIRFELDTNVIPGASGDTLLTTRYFAVTRRQVQGPVTRPLPVGRCYSLMILDAAAPLRISHAGSVEPSVVACRGDTIVLPAGLASPIISTTGPAAWLEVTLPQ